MYYMSACMSILLSTYSLFSCSELIFNKTQPFPNQTVYSLSDKFMNFPITAIMNLQKDGILHYIFKANDVSLGDLDLQLSFDNKNLQVYSNGLKPTKQENLQLLSCFLQRILDDIGKEYVGITKHIRENVYKSITIKKTLRSLAQDLSILSVELR